MCRHPGQPAQLICAEAEDVVQAGVGAIEVERGIEVPLLTEHAGRQLVGEAPVTLRQTLEVAVACSGERFA